MRTVRILAVAVVLCTLIPSAATARSCRCEVTDRFQAAYDVSLNLSQSERRDARARHLPWGVPVTPATATNEHLLVNEHDVIAYDDDLRVPLWVAYRLRDHDLAVPRDRTQSRVWVRSRTSILRHPRGSVLHRIGALGRREAGSGCIKGRNPGRQHGNYRTGRRQL